MRMEKLRDADRALVPVLGEHPECQASVGAHAFARDSPTTEQAQAARATSASAGAPHEGKPSLRVERKSSPSVAAQPLGTWSKTTEGSTAFTVAAFPESGDAAQLVEDAAECARRAAAAQAVQVQARLVTGLPSIAVDSALAVVLGGWIRLMGSALEPSRMCFMRVSASTSTLWCDGVSRGTLLGALPCLTHQGETALWESAELRQELEGRCFRLVLKSYELDAIARSSAEMHSWVRGINFLPLGAKHWHLTQLALAQT